MDLPHERLCRVICNPVILDLWCHHLLLGCSLLWIPDAAQLHPGSAAGKEGAAAGGCGVRELTVICGGVRGCREGRECVCVQGA
eukprot:1158818-Pelagomonas_calceolata.AAC.3